MILHSDDRNGPCDCRVVIGAARGRNVFKEMGGLGDDGTGGVRTVIPGGRGLGGSIYQDKIRKNDIKIESIELTELRVNNNSGALHIPPSLIPLELSVTKDYLGPSLRPFQCLVTSLSRRILKPVMGTVSVYLAPLFVLNGLANTMTSKLLMPGLNTTRKLQYLIFSTIPSNNGQLQSPED